MAKIHYVDPAGNMTAIVRGEFDAEKRVELAKSIMQQEKAEQVGFETAPVNGELRDAVQKVLFEMYEDGTFMKIAEKYADYNLPEMICLQDYIEGNAGSEESGSAE